MTTSTWNEGEIKNQFAGCQTLKEIIARIENEFSSRGEVICEIRVNGMILQEVDESKFAENSVSGIRDLAVRSDRPSDLVRDALLSASEFLPDLERSALKTAELLRSSDLPRAKQSFVETVDGCRWLTDTLVHVRGAASGIGQPLTHAERWFEAEKILSKVLSEVSDGYVASDFVLVADILEYELTGALGIWSEALALESKRRS
jgi:hypothetical protein